MEFTSLYRGKRHLELSKHLGNFNGCWFCEAKPYRHESPLKRSGTPGVQVVLSDKRISVCDEELEVEYFKAEVLSAMDYYPGGMMMLDQNESTDKNPQQKVVTGYDRPPLYQQS